MAAAAAAECAGARRKNSSVSLLNADEDSSSSLSSSSYVRAMLGLSEAIDENVNADDLRDRDSSGGGAGWR